MVLDNGYATITLESLPPYLYNFVYDDDECLFESYKSMRRYTDKLGCVIVFYNFASSVYEDVSSGAVYDIPTRYYVVEPTDG